MADYSPTISIIIQIHYFSPYLFVNETHIIFLDSDNIFISLSGTWDFSQADAADDLVRRHRFHYRWEVHICWDNLKTSVTAWERSTSSTFSDSRKPKTYWFLTWNTDWSSSTADPEPSKWLWNTITTPRSKCGIKSPQSTIFTRVHQWAALWFPRVSMNLCSLNKSCW